MDDRALEAVLCGIQMTHEDACRFRDYMRKRGYDAVDVKGTSGSVVGSGKRPEKRRSVLDAVGGVSRRPRAV